MNETKINVCLRCRAIYTEQKAAHCKSKGCDRTDQAVILINAKLFWGRIANSLESGITGDIHGIIRRAGRRLEKVVVKEDAPNPKDFTGDISE